MKHDWGRDAHQRTKNVPQCSTMNGLGIKDMSYHGDTLSFHSAPMLRPKRQVEQLKTQLRNMGGADIDVDCRRQQASHRPKPRPHHLGGRASIVGGAAVLPNAATRTATKGRGGLNMKSAIVATATAVVSGKRRSVAPIPLSESPPPLTHRRRCRSWGGSRDGCGDGGTSNGAGSAHGGKTETKNHRIRRRDDTRGGKGRRPLGQAVGVVHTAAEGKHDDGTNHVVHHAANIRKGASTSSEAVAPSLPRRQDQRPFDGRPSATAAVATTNSISTTTATTPRTSSPVQRLRNARLRSPESNSGASGGAEAPVCLSATAGQSLLPERPAKRGKEVTGGSGAESLDTATSEKIYEGDNRVEAGESIHIALSEVQSD